MIGDILLQSEDNCGESSTYTRYALVCSRGMEYHTLKTATVRMVAMQSAKHYDENNTCGPHRVIEATCTFTRTPWGPLTGMNVQEATRVAMLRDLLSRKCPKCEVEPGANCENLTARRKGEKRLTSWPHAERGLELL